MIFRVPPINPWCAIIDEKEYMVWTVKENTKTKDDFNDDLIMIAEKFKDKTFIQLKINTAKDFAKAHGLETSEAVLRVKDGTIVWTAYRPMYGVVEKQAKKMGKRTGQKSILQIPLKELEKRFQGLKDGNFKLKTLDMDDFDETRDTLRFKVFNRRRTEGDVNILTKMQPTVKLIKIKPRTSIQRRLESGGNSNWNWKEPSTINRRPKFQSPLKLFLTNTPQKTNSKPPKIQRLQSSSSSNKSNSSTSSLKSRLGQSVLSIFSAFTDRSHRSIHRSDSFSSRGREKRSCSMVPLYKFYMNQRGSITSINENGDLHILRNRETYKRSKSCGDALSHSSKRHISSTFDLDEEPDMDQEFEPSPKTLSHSVSKTLLHSDGRSKNESTLSSEEIGVKSNVPREMSYYFPENKNLPDLILGNMQVIPPTPSAIAKNSLNINTDKFSSSINNKLMLNKPSENSFYHSPNNNLLVQLRENRGNRLRQPREVSFNSQGQINRQSQLSTYSPVIMRQPRENSYYSGVWRNGLNLSAFDDTALLRIPRENSYYSRSGTPVTAITASNESIENCRKYSIRNKTKTNTDNEPISHRKIKDSYSSEDINFDQLTVVKRNCSILSHRPREVSYYSQENLHQSTVVKRNCSILSHRPREVSYYSTEQINQENLLLENTGEIPKISKNIPNNAGAENRRPTSLIPDTENRLNRNRDASFKTRSQQKTILPLFDSWFKAHRSRNSLTNSSLKKSRSSLSLVKEGSVAPISRELSFRLNSNFRNMTVHEVDEMNTSISANVEREPFDFPNVPITNTTPPKENDTSKSKRKRQLGVNPGLKLNLNALPTLDQELPPLKESGSSLFDEVMNSLSKDFKFEIKRQVSNQSTSSEFFDAQSSFSNCSSNSEEAKNQMSDSSIYYDSKSSGSRSSLVKIDSTKSDPSSLEDRLIRQQPDSNLVVDQSQISPSNISSNDERNMRQEFRNLGDESIKTMTL